MKLFYSPASPFARKCRVVAMELGLEVDFIDSHPFKDGADLLAANPLGRVPCLVTDDGTSLVESDLICAWLDEKGGGRFLPGGDAKWPALRLQAIADGLMDLTVARRIETVRDESLHSAQWIGRREAGIRRTLDLLESEADGFAGSRHIGSLAVAVALDYVELRFPESGWRDRPGLAAHQADWMTVAAFADTAPPPGS